MKSNSSGLLTCSIRPLTQHPPWHQVRCGICRRPIATCTYLHVVCMQVMTLLLIYYKRQIHSKHNALKSKSHQDLRKMSHLPGAGLESVVIDSVGRYGASLRSQEASAAQVDHYGDAPPNSGVNTNFRTPNTFRSNGNTQLSKKRHRTTPEATKRRISRGSTSFQS